MIKKLKIIYSFLKVKKFKDRESLLKYQKNKLNIFLKNLVSNFYPNSTNLEDFPIIDKKIFMDNFDLINSIGITKEEAYIVAINCEKSRDFSQKLNKITVGLSSGTSGNRGVFLVSEDESAIWAGYILKKMLPKPLFSHHEIAFFLRSNSNLYESVKSRLIKFEFFDLITPLATHIDKLNKFQPTILIAPAQVLRILALDKNLSINPKKIISVAEVLEESDEKIIAKRFNQKVHQIYQCTEGFLAHTCDQGNLHLNEDRVLIEKEWIDEKSGRFIPIITDFYRTTQPVIRYRLDDILILDREPCSCGSPFIKIKKIEGRCDDILKMKTLKGENYLLFPDFVRRAMITACDELKEYSVIHQNNTLHLYLEPLSTKNKVEISMKNLYKEHNIKPPKHLYHQYIQDSFTKKRRRVKEL